VFVLCSSFPSVLLLPWLVTRHVLYLDLRLRVHAHGGQRGVLWLPRLPLTFRSNPFFAPNPGEMSTRSLASATTGVGSPGASRLGVKRVLNDLCDQVSAQADQLREITQRAEASDSTVQDLIQAMEDRLRAHIEDVRKELCAHQEATKAQIAQLREHIGAVTGETGILKEQARDTHKRLTEMGNQLHLLNVEIMGD